MAGLSRAVFDDRVAAYADSASHRHGTSLVLTVALARGAPGARALDVSTGTGFTAHALAEVGLAVLAADLAPSMLRHAVSHAPRPISGVLADVHRLGLQGEMFDVVTCRHALHHYADPTAAVREMGRVLRPAGRLVIADTVAPDDSALAREMHEIEVARDASHVRNHTEAEYQALLRSAGLHVERSARCSAEQEFEAWCARTDAPPEVAERLWDRFTAGARVRNAFRVRTEQGVRRFAWPVLVTAARRP